MSKQESLPNVPTSAKGHSAIARRLHILVLALLIFSCAAHEPSPAARGDQPILVRAASWLWSQQAEDGGWHSQTYGLLKSGQAYTPFILHTLLQVPERVVSRPPGGVERALAFMRRHMNPEGALGLVDPDVLEYPNYSTAYALQCFQIAGSRDDRERIARMQSYLLEQQYAEARGIAAEHPAYGGWGFGGPVRTGYVGHMDLAHTRRVLEALRLSGGLNSEAARRAEHLLRLVQRHPSETRPQPTMAKEPVGASNAATYDGGFYFSPIVLAANKGGPQADFGSPFRSYATATCDGLLALLAAGVAMDDERVQKAADWLRRHPRIDRPEGIPDDRPEPWADAMHFYHLAVRREAWSAIHWPDDWRRQIEAHLAAFQQADGRFANTRSQLMKEDDPLLCTALAIIALSGG